MVNKIQPSRAEVNDLTNAVLDGCDGVLLSAETAYGNNPVAALRTAAAICVEAERHLNYAAITEHILKTKAKTLTIAENICHCAV